MIPGIPRHLIEQAARDPRNAHAKDALERLGRASAPSRTLSPRESENASQGVSKATGRAGETVRLVLPLPPSVNSYWRSVPASRNRTARVLISEQGRRFKTACRNASAAQCKEPMAGDVSIRGVVYFANRRRDLDNCIKPMLDALIGVVYHDDRQICHLEFTKALDLTRPRVEVAVSVWSASSSTSAGMEDG